MITIFKKKEIKDVLSPETVCFEDKIDNFIYDNRIYIGIGFFSFSVFLIVYCLYFAVRTVTITGVV